MYARTGQRAGMGRVARTYRLQGLGRLGSPFGRRAAVGFGNRATLMALDQLAQDTGYGVPVNVGLPSFPSTPTTSWGPSQSPLTPATPTTPAAPSTPGWTPAQEAQVLTAAITTGGVLGNKPSSAVPRFPTIRPQVSTRPPVGQRFRVALRFRARSAVYFRILSCCWRSRGLWRFRL